MSTTVVSIGGKPYNFEATKLQQALIEKRQKDSDFQLQGTTDAEQLASLEQYIASLDPAQWGTYVSSQDPSSNGQLIDPKACATEAAKLLSLTALRTAGVVASLPPTPSQDKPQRVEIQSGDEVQPAAAEVRPEEAGENPPDPPSTDGSGSNNNEGSWKKYGAIGTLVVGVIAFLGALATSDESSKGKGILATIGGFLAGAGLLLQFPSISSLIGLSSEKKAPDAPPQA